MAHYIIILSILSPTFVFREITVGLLDFLPLFLLTHIILTGKTKIVLTTKAKSFFKLVICLLFVWLISTALAVWINFEPESSIKSLLQLYRRSIAILVIPLYVIYSNENYSFNSLIKYLSILLIIIGAIGISINFSPELRELYLNNISNSGQTVSGLIFRNMGFIGEPSYFAILLGIVIFANIFLASYKKKSIFTLLLIIVLISTFSKSVFLSVLLVLFFLYMNKTTLLVVLASLLTTTTAFMLFNSIFSTFVTNYLGNEALASIGNRVDKIWGNGINIFSSNELYYFFGLGLKGLKSYFNMEGVHNNFIAFILDFGLIGGPISIFLLMFVIPYYINPKSKFLISSTMMLLLVSIVHEPYYHSNVLALLFFFYALIINHKKIRAQDDSRRNVEKVYT